MQGSHQLVVCIPPSFHQVNFSHTRNPKKFHNHSPSQEEIPYTRTRKIKRRARPQPLQNLKIHHIQKTPNQLLLRRRNVRPQRVVGLDNLQPFLLGGVFVLGEAVVEEDFDGGGLAGGGVLNVFGVVGDEAYESTWVACKLWDSNGREVKGLYGTEYRTSYIADT